MVDIPNWNSEHPPVVFILRIALLSFLMLPAVALAQSPGVEFSDSTPRTNQVNQITLTDPSPADSAQRTLRTNQVRRLPTKTRQYSGIIPALNRSRNPLQLINPFAAVSREGSLDNVVIDPATNRPTGVAVFAIRF